MVKHWLFKTEPSAYSIENLKKEGRTHWEGIRNYQARNLLRDEVKKGDWVLIYHSNADPPGVAGLARVACDAYSDVTALDPESRYFDPKATAADPRWVRVDVKFAKVFKRFIPLETLKVTPGLEAMWVIKNSRLSIQPVRPEEFEIITKLGG